MLISKVNVTCIVESSSLFALLMSRVLLALTFLFHTSLSCAETTYITNDNSNGAINIKALFLLDDGSLTIKDILDEKHQQQFKSSNSFPINAGFSKSTAWVKVTYKDNRTIDYANDLVLELSNPLLDHIEVYRQFNDSLTAYKTGALEPYKDREIDNDYFVFRLPAALIKPNTVYLKIRSETPLIIPLYIKSIYGSFSSGSLFSYESRVFVSMLLLITGYNVLLSFTQRDLQQYYYLAWYSMATITCCLLMGIAQRYLGDQATWFTEHLGVMASIAAAMLLVHAAAYVQINKHSPLLYKLTLFIAVIFGLNSLIILGTDHRLWQWTLFLCCISGIITLAIITYGIYLKQSMAWFGVIVFSPTFIGISIYTFASANIIESNWLTLNSLFIGITLTGVTIAAAAGNKVSMERNRTQALETINRKALEKNNALLKKTNAAKDAFLSTISHELRTPLNGASGALALLESSAQSAAEANNIAIPDEADSLFKVINQSINDMISLINSIIGFSELHTEHAKIHKGYFSPYNSIISIIEKRKKAITNNEIDMHISIESLLAIEVLSDEEKYEKIIGNIFDNAIKFTHDGSITIVGKIESSEKEPAKLIVSIIDTGIGIAESEIETIIEPFSQGDQSYSRKYEGLGIGLAICKKTLALLGGDLKVTSELGKGTCVQITFEIIGSRCRPEIEQSSLQLTNLHTISAPIRVSENEEIPSANQHLDDLCILIVEDNKVNQLIAKKMLQRRGFTPIVAENGAIAVDLFRKQEIDLILMDCQMPIMDGFEATRQIRALTTDDALLPIIAVTANTSDEDRRKCKECGMNEILEKPISYDTLMLIIDKWAQKKGSASIRNADV